MTTILITTICVFLIVTIVVIQVHYALGGTPPDLLAVMATICRITIVLVALAQGPEALNVLGPVLGQLLDEFGPSG